MSMGKSRKGGSTRFPVSDLFGNRNLCLDILQINEAIEATKLQPLSQDSMEQQDGEQGIL